MNQLSMSVSGSSQIVKLRPSTVECAAKLAAAAKYGRHVAEQANWHFSIMSGLTNDLCQEANECSMVDYSVELYNHLTKMASEILFLSTITKKSLYDFAHNMAFEVKLDAYGSPSNDVKWPASNPIQDHSFVYYDLFYSICDVIANDAFAALLREDLLYLRPGVKNQPTNYNYFTFICTHDNEITITHDGHGCTYNVMELLQEYALHCELLSELLNNLSNMENNFLKKSCAKN